MPLRAYRGRGEGSLGLAYLRPLLPLLWESRSGGKIKTGKPLAITVHRCQRIHRGCKLVSCRGPCCTLPGAEKGQEEVDVLVAWPRQADTTDLSCLPCPLACRISSTEHTNGREVLNSRGSAWTVGTVAAGGGGVPEASRLEKAAATAN